MPQFSKKNIECGKKREKQLTAAGHEEWNMSEVYDATYHAVTSKLGYVDINEAVQSAIRDMNISHYFDQAAESMKQAASQYERPSIMMRPKLSIDGNMWCALYGEDLQNGVAGFGESPAKAFYDFDTNFYKPLTQPTQSVDKE